MRMTDVGNNRRHRLAGNRFFHRPQELDDRLRPDEDNLLGRKPELFEPQAIRQSRFERIGLQLQVEDCRPDRVDQGFGLGEGKPQRRPRADQAVGKNFMQAAAGRREKTARNRHIPAVLEGGIGLDRGDLLPQRFERRPIAL